MQTRLPMRHIQRPRLLVSGPHPTPQSAALPRRIASGVFFINPNEDGKLNDNDNDALLSSNTLINLEITHAVVPRGSDVRFSWGMKALFVGPQDPLSKIVAWMRAVRRLGAHIIVGDFAAAAGYLVVELGLTPRTAWLRIARGIPPVGDFVLARLCALAVVHKKEKENGMRRKMIMDPHLEHRSVSAFLGTGMAKLAAGIRAWVFRHGHPGGIGLEHGQNLDLSTQLLASIVN
ncbi:hypothetical protein BJV77DRAFT_373140 [Russula vinacea]|nr:hypothetical protein BJV77DRAFT_373140 [Russula vinacea]